MPFRRDLQGYAPPLEIEGGGFAGAGNQFF